jgi:hypothetical protein
MTAEGYDVRGRTDLPRLRMGCPPNASPLLKQYVSSFVRLVNGISLDVVEYSYDDGRLDVSDYDLALIPPAQVRELASEGNLLSLTSFRDYCVRCRAIAEPFDYFRDEPFGIPIRLGDEHDSVLQDRSLTRTHEFMKGDGLTLSAINPAVLENADGADFFLLQEIILALSYFMPVIEDHFGELIIDVSEEQPVLSTREQVDLSRASLPLDSVSLGECQRDRHERTLYIDLSFSNDSTEPIRYLKAYVFGTTAEALLNRHERLFLESRFNRVGPLAAYHYGPVMPGDTVTRRIDYDLTAGNQLRLGFNPPLLGKPHVSFFQGNTCITEKPEPIPDPFPEGVIFQRRADEGECYDNSCSSICDPHHCASIYNVPCGCFADRDLPPDRDDEDEVAARVRVVSAARRRVEAIAAILQG